jgi:D-isomer specific 2-hydroxyacid dehydrogenase-like protein
MYKAFPPRHLANSLLSRFRNESPTMLQLYPLTVTRTIFNCAQDARFSFGEDTALVAVQHMLLQTVDLFQTIGAMGLNVENIFALGKVYSNSPPVIQRLRDMGVTVIDSTTPEPGEFRSYFQRDVEKLWQVVAETLRHRNIKRILVLDDGGICITSVPPEVLQRYALCGVEQTSVGMFLFEEKPPPFAVMSWARAAVKLEIGSPIFAQCFLDCFHERFLHGRHLQSQQLGVIGMGSIGRAVANRVVRQGNELFYYDPNTDLHVPSSLRDVITRVDSVDDLMVHCDYVLGCSGRNPFKDKWPLRHRPGIKLLSASSGDQEFGPIIRDLKERPDFNIAPGTWDIISEHGPSGPIHIAYRGYPYTFVSRGIEAAPTQVVQFDTGGLLIALVQARLFLTYCETGLEQNRGIHRVSPRAQRFIYERWARAMKEEMIDVVNRFDYDPDLLRAVEHDDWFIKQTEPRPTEDYRPVKPVEELLDQFVCQGRFVRAQG